MDQLTGYGNQQRSCIRCWHREYETFEEHNLSYALRSYTGCHCRFHRDDARAWLHEADIYGEF